MTGNKKYVEGLFGEEDEGREDKGVGEWSRKDWRKNTKEQDVFWRGSRKGK